MAVWMVKSGRGFFFTAVCAAFALVGASTAQGLDFKIELPPQKGVVTPEDEDFFDDVLSVSADQADAVVPEVNEAPSVPPIRAVPQESSRRWLPAQQVPENTTRGNAIKSNPSNSAVSKGTIGKTQPNIFTFPNPSCLSGNVSFWKRIYSDVDTNEALIHDREDVGIVYASVRLGGSESQRRQSTKLLREHYKSSLRGLAAKANKPKEWSQTERTLARQFRPSELTYSRIMEASENVRVQQGLKSRFNSGIQRSLQYLPTIKSILKNQNLPLDIAYLPHVESSYVNHAKSKVGAVGLWQLMPATMQLLMGKSAVSRRTDPTIATVAAAKLLKQNFNATGSWPLALTAYNHGLGGVLRAVRHTSSTDLCKIIERYNSPSFRFASSNFYAQFLAARQVALQRYSELSKNQAVGRIVAPLLASREKGAL